MINPFWNWIFWSGYRVILSSSQKPSRSDFYSSGFDHHSGYGHSSYDHSGYDHSSYGGGYVDYKECCPLVVDNLTFVSLIGFIILATYFLRQAILLNIMGRRKRRDISNINFNNGKIHISRLVSLYFSSFSLGWSATLKDWFLSWIHKPTILPVAVDARSILAHFDHKVPYFSNWYNWCSPLPMAIIKTVIAKSLIPISTLQSLHSFSSTY